jgi:ribosomal protein S18 acetylase RimI-like enzyme
MSYSVLFTAEEHFAGLHSALVVVAREKRFLAFLQAPPLQEALAFYRHIVTNDLCEFVALQDEQVVGWCDVLPTHGEARAHVVHLGIGLVPHARHKGLGVKLLEATITKAHAKGIIRIELSVRADNLDAKALYERFGFKVEGVKCHDFLVDGQYHDAYAMALLRRNDAQL